jgi:hypothetical protein
MTHEGHCIGGGLMPEKYLGTIEEPSILELNTLSL